MPPVLPIAGTQSVGGAASCVIRRSALSALGRMVDIGG